MNDFLKPYLVGLSCSRIAGDGKIGELTSELVGDSTGVSGVPSLISFSESTAAPSFRVIVSSETSDEGDEMSGFLSCLIGV